MTRRNSDSRSGGGDRLLRRQGFQTAGGVDAELPARVGQARMFSIVASFCTMALASRI